MKTTKIALAAAATLGLTAASAMSAPTEVWQATGLAGPECALPDPAAGIIYVSNVNGDPMGKDAKGYIAKVSMDGKKVEKWVDGLKAQILADAATESAQTGKPVRVDLGAK